jgi:hypothetical protein
MGRGGGGYGRCPDNEWSCGRTITANNSGNRRIYYCFDKFHRHDNFNYPVPQSLLAYLWFVLTAIFLIAILFSVLCFGSFFEKVPVSSVLLLFGDVITLFSIFPINFPESISCLFLLFASFSCSQSSPF